MIEDLSKAMSKLPARLQTPERLFSFPPNGRLYPLLSGAVVYDDACNLAPSIVRKMPNDDSIVTFSVKVNGDTYPFQLAKAESVNYLESIRLVSSRNNTYRLEAGIHRPEMITAYLKGTELDGILKPTHRVLHYDLIARQNGQPFPPIHASTFMPWALRAFSYHRPTHIMAEWEPDSVNHKLFYDALEDNGENLVDAISHTWSHKRITQLGFKLIPQAEIHGALNKKNSPYGHPNTVVHVLYKK